ncbi:bile acid:sodium symporter [Desulforamulus aquiferis]|uniref:Bile acid:sodium symporter n=2 Tax=Desulforamulus aquiferis TaxID=1397668 RepID=A0AAW7ZAX7_9FIRM|nr:bile acid:sodium symporter [Desulforamulus aquiferis]
MIKFLLLAIILGLIIGYVFPGLGQEMQFFYPISLFIMLYPMMIGIEINEVKEATRRIGFMSVVMLFNYLVSPLLGAFLAKLFLTDYPDFAVGLILTGVVPCAGMIVAWTGLAKGNAPMTLVITVVSLLAGIFLIPFWMLNLAGTYVPIDVFKMFKTIFLTILLPLILGNITRVWLVKKLGSQRFVELKGIFPGISAIGMYSVFFISMCAESVTLVSHPEYLFRISVPLVIFYTLLFSGSVLYARLAKISYPDMVAFTYGVSGKNISIALALAVMFFSPLTVMIIAIKPLIQVTFMAGFYRLTPILNGYWEKKIPTTKEENNESLNYHRLS